MGVTWTVPAALWLLVAIPFVWIAPRFGRTTFNSRQRAVQAAIRSLLLAALTLAIARPVIATGSSRQSIVYLVDVSHSISGHAIEDAATRIDDLDRHVRPAHSRIVAFGANAVLVDSTAALRQLAQVDVAKPNGPAVDRSESDLDAGLAAARAELAPGHVPRIVLFTDAQPTAGDVGAAVGRLAAEHVPVSVEPMAPRFIGDAWVDALDVPAQVGAGATFATTISLASQREVTGTIELRVNGKSVARAPVTLSKGVTPVTVDAAIDTAGAQVIEAVLSVPNDPLAPNNSLSRAIWISPHPKVLYVEGTPASAHYLASALTQSGYEVAVKPPTALPVTAAALDPWDVVILSDLARAAISDAAMLALTDWVEKEGGGLLVAGGESVFGEGGYRKTALERLTPVTFERKDELQVGRPGGRRRHDRRTVGGHPHLQRSVRVGRAASQRGQEPRRHPQEDRRDRARWTHTHFSCGRAGLSGASQRQSAREARDSAVRRAVLPR
jgi:Ca-activated chloride channel homolog